MEEQQEQGQPVPEETPTNPEPDTKYTDKDLDKYKGAARKEGRQSAINELLGELDVESVDDVKALVDAYKQVEAEEATDADKERTAHQKTQRQLADAKVRVEELEALQERAKALEERLGSITNARMEGLAKPYRELVGKMPVEERADWLEANAELLDAGKPAGSPPSPAPAKRNGHKQDEESDKKAREEMKRTSRI